MYGLLSNIDGNSTESTESDTDSTYSIDEEELLTVISTMYIDKLTISKSKYEQHVVSLITLFLKMLQCHYRFMTLCIFKSPKYKVTRRGELIIPSGIYRKITNLLREIYNDRRLPFVLDPNELNLLSMIMTKYKMERNYRNNNGENDSTDSTDRTDTTSFSSDDDSAYDDSSFTSFSSGDSVMESYGFILRKPMTNANDEPSDNNNNNNNDDNNNNNNNNNNNDNNNDDDWAAAAA